MNILSPGSVIAVQAGPFRHVGIVGNPTGPFGPSVISTSHRRGQVAEESLSEFANGGRLSFLGYPGELPWSMVVTRARSRLGEPWNLFSANCEHFVRWAHDLEVRSPQLRGAVALVTMVVLVAIASRAR